MNVPDLAVEAACRHLLTRFIRHYDGGEVAASAACFADDAVWTHAGHDVVGIAAIMDELATRPASPPARHLVTSFLLLASDAVTASAVAQLVLFYTELDENGRRHGVVTGVGEFATDFVLTTAGWRIAAHAGRESFSLEPRS